jgi:hypothetical protein
MDELERPEKTWWEKRLLIDFLGAGRKFKIIQNIP